MAKSTKQPIYKGAYGGSSRSGLVTVGFAEVGYKSTKKGKCETCGKQRQVTVTFTQTVSQSNKNDDGSRKTENQIRNQETEKMEAWEAKPHICNNCAEAVRAVAKAEKEAGERHG